MKNSDKETLESLKIKLAKGEITPKEYKELRKIFDRAHLVEEDLGGGKIGEKVGRFCIKCGEKLPKGAIYCPKCGLDLTLKQKDKRGVTSTGKLGINYQKIIIASFIVFLILVSIVILKNVPLKYDESNYREVFTLNPSEWEGRWFPVIKDYTVSVRYTVKDKNLVTIAIYPPSFIPPPPYTTPSIFGPRPIYAEKGSTGSFSLQMEEGGQYHLYLRNPNGATITVTVEITVSRWTTFL